MPSPTLAKRTSDQELETARPGDGTPQIVAPPLIGSCRLGISITLMLGSFVGILTTYSLGFAIVCINQNSNNNTFSNSTNCSENEQREPQSCVQPGNELFWSKNMQGLLLGGTFYGVVASQILIGYISDKYGYCKLQMLIGASVLGIANIISPLVIIYLGDYYFFALRIIMGVAVTCVMAGSLNVVRYWASPKDQGLLVGISMGGISIANALINPISATVCYYSGWHSIFYFAGACGLLWVILGCFVVYDTPKKHPRVSAEEKQYLDLYGLTSNKKQAKKSEVAIPWSKITTSVPVWSVIITTFFFFAVSKLIVLILPIFIKEVLDFSITENGIYSALPSVGNVFVHFTAGPIFDYVRSLNKFSLTNLRKIFHAMGTVIPAAMMFTVSQLGPDQKYLIIAFITIGLSLSEATFVVGFGNVLMDVAPNYMGILQGINNTLGLTPGFIMPLVIAALTPNGAAEEWNHIYLLFGCLLSMSFLVFTFTGSARRQKWAETKQPAAL